MKTYFFTLLVLLLTACSEQPGVTDTLNRAESLMDTSPDSSYTLLQTLPSDEFRRQDTRARYALLYTQAQDKNYIDETCDSLISAAVDYYREHDDDRTRFLSLYYKGRILYNGGDYLHAMLAYSEAEALVPRVDDAYYSGLLYTQMGSVYKKYSDFPKSLKAFQSAHTFYKLADKDLHQSYALLDQANVYWHLNEYDECESLYNAVLIEAERLQNDVLKSIALGELFMVYIEQGNIEKAHTLFNKLDDTYKQRVGTAKFRSSIAEYHAQIGENKNAEYFMQQAWSKAKNAQDSVSLYFVESRLYELMGNHKKAYHNLSKGIKMQTSRIHNVLQQPVLSVQLDNLAQELEFSKYRRKVEKTLWMFSIILFIALSMFVIIRFWQKIKEKNESIVDSNRKVYHNNN